MNLHNLEAVLFYEKINVKGLARISLPTSSCEFLSDFVPILPLNSNVTVVTKINDAPFLKITGPVFLSSKKFMRIQPVNLAIYEKAERLFDVPVNIKAKIVRNHIFTSHSYSPCTILSCSATSFVLTGSLSPEHGDGKIELLVEEPIFAEPTYIQLKYANDGMLFGKSKKGAKYIYNITKIDRECHYQLLDYIRQKGISQIARSMNRGYY